MRKYPASFPPRQRGHRPRRRGVDGVGPITRVGVAGHWRSWGDGLPDPRCTPLPSTQRPAATLRHRAWGMAPGPRCLGIKTCRFRGVLKDLSLISPTRATRHFASSATSLLDGFNSFALCKQTAKPASADHLRDQKTTPVADFPASRPGPDSTPFRSLAEDGNHPGGVVASVLINSSPGKSLPSFTLSHRCMPLSPRTSGGRSIPNPLLRRAYQRPARPHGQVGAVCFWRFFAGLIFATSPTRPTSWLTAAAGP